MTKTFTHAGVSRDKGKLGFRASSRPEYIDILLKHGHTDMAIVPLPNTMTKPEAVGYLLSIDFADGNAEVLEVLNKKAASFKLEGHVPAPKPRGRKPRARASDSDETVINTVATDDNTQDNTIDLTEAVAERTTPGSEAFQAWAAAANAEGEGEDEGTVEGEDKAAA